MGTRRYFTHFGSEMAIYPKLRITFIKLHSKTFIIKHFGSLYFNKDEKTS